MKRLDAEITNGNCDGRCSRVNIPVTRLPLGGGAGLFLCRGCFTHEMTFRADRNRNLEGFAQFDMFRWPSPTMTA